MAPFSPPEFRQSLPPIPASESMALLATPPVPLVRVATPPSAWLDTPRPQSATPASPHQVRPQSARPLPRPPLATPQPRVAGLLGPLFSSYPGGLDLHPPSTAAILPVDQDPFKPDLKLLKPFPSDLCHDAFEELCPLGDGRCVHKVRHKETGEIFARKTICTLKVPRSQLARVLKVAATADHPNIVDSYGAYLITSSSEVRIYMEYCEGRNLDLVGRRMVELGAVVSEKLYGRLAEGVRKNSSYGHSNY